MNTRYFMLALLAISVTGLAACENTVNGAGRDIEHAGESVQNAVPPK